MVDTWPSGSPSSYGTGSGFSTPTSRSYSPSAATYESWNDQDGWDAGDVAYVVGAAAGFAIGATAGVVVSGVLIAPIGTSCVIAMGAGVTSGLYGGWGAETAFRALMNHTMAKDIGPNTLSKLGYTVTVSGSGGVGLQKK